MKILKYSSFVLPAYKSGSSIVTPALERGDASRT
jgi:hypothetical protein